MAFSGQLNEPCFEVGCSDSEVYSGEWRTENYIVVTLLGIIAFFILLGTALDAYEKETKKTMGYQIVKAFSLKENLKFIFAVPATGGSGRFDCLEGMRSLRQFSLFSQCEGRMREDGGWGC